MLTQEFSVLDLRWEGYQAYQNGSKIEDCPYSDYDLRRHWEDGYYDAAWDD